MNEHQYEEKKNYLTIEPSLIPELVVSIEANEGKDNIDMNELRRYLEKKKNQ
jgi:hypothetical protein